MCVFATLMTLSEQGKKWMIAGNKSQNLFSLDGPTNWGESSALCHKKNTIHQMIVVKGGEMQPLIQHYLFYNYKVWSYTTFSKWTFGNLTV